jgi:chromosome partitioning protein
MSEITDAHGISHATAKRSIEAGIVAAFTPPQPNRLGYVEYWFLPEQVGPALRVWQSRGIEMHDCPECPHDHDWRLPRSALIARQRLLAYTPVADRTERGRARMATRLKVFVSYSRAESAFAEKLAQDLRAIGLHVWLDQAEIAPGADVVATINRGLAGAQWLVVVLTPDALASTFVRREVNAALLLQDRGKLAGVVPVLAKPCDPDTIPPLWAELQRVDAMHDYDQAVIDLLGAFASTLPPPYADILLSAASTVQKHDGSQRRLADITTLHMLPVSVIRPFLPLSPTERDVSAALNEMMPDDTERASEHKRAPGTANAPRREPLARLVGAPTTGTAHAPHDTGAPTHEAAITLAITFAIANQKGHVGKTTTAINLAAYLAQMGRRVLLVDMSPGAEATTSLGLDARHVRLSMYELLVDDRVTPREVLKAELRPNLSLPPASPDGNLYAADIELLSIQEGRELRLKKALDTLKSQFDFVLIDCPSWLSLLMVNALSAADGVIVPVPCEYFALEGMQQLLKTIHLVRGRLNPHILLFGVVLTMFDPRTKLGPEVIREVSEQFPREKFHTIIPLSERLAEAPGYGQTILEHEPRSPGARAYQELAEEVIKRAAMTEAANAQWPASPPPPPSPSSAAAEAPAPPRTYYPAPAPSTGAE